MARRALIRSTTHLVSTVRLARRRPRPAQTIPAQPFVAWSHDEAACTPLTEIPMAPATIPAGERSEGWVTQPPPELRTGVVPRRVVSDTSLRLAEMSPRQMFVLHLVDGSTPLDEIIAASGLDEREAIASVADLVARGMVQLFE